MKSVASGKATLQQRYMLYIATHNCIYSISLRKVNLFVFYKEVFLTYV